MTPGWHRLGLASALGALVSLGSGTAPGQEPLPSEYQVKAAFLFNFAKFVEWPAEALNGPIQIAVLGEDPFRATLDETVRDKTVNGRPIQVRRFRTIGEVPEAHILFICTSERRRLAEILEGIGTRSMLTVSELEDFTQQGGMIQFLMEENKVRFRINAAPAERARLRISARLLNLSR